MLNVLLLSFTLFAAGPNSAHVHGAGQMSMAFDGVNGKLQFEIPAQGLFGFEHVAKTKKDINKIAAVLQIFEQRISEMVVFNESLGCRISKEAIIVNSNQGHSDVDASFRVQCAKSILGSEMVFNFQKVFPELKKMQVEVLADDVQKSMEVNQNGVVLGIK